MKTIIYKYIVLIAGLIITLSALGQSSVDKSKTYVKTEVIEVTGKTSESALNSMSENDKQIVIEYFDDAGRPVQNIGYKLSPGGNDVVGVKDYDEFGLTPKQYLGFTKAANNGAYITNAITHSSGYSSSDQYLFYNNASTDKIANSTAPYQETEFESSPLNRVKKQGAAGSDWQLSGGNPASFDYGFNDQYDVRHFTIDNGTFSCEEGKGELYSGEDYYYEGELTMSTARGPDWPGGTSKLYTVENYSDKLGRKVMTRQYVTVNTTVTPLETYYVYDDLGRLRFVLPPEAIENLSGNVDDLVFSYKYDQKGRLVEKKIPGADSIYYVYDSYSRLVLTQNGEQRNDNQWSYIIYDHLNRMKESGVYTDARTFSAITTALATSTGYEPTTRTAHLYTYYDDYSWSGVHTFDSTNNISGYSDTTGNVRYFDDMTGVVTGTKVRVLDGETTPNWIVSTIFYDDRSRVIEVVKDVYPGGTETVASKYDFLNRIIETRHYQNFDSQEQTTVLSFYTYDQGGRLTKEEMAIVGDTDNDTVTLAEMEYNEIGQLVEKDLHDSNAQSIDYRYNIIGWLTSINNSNLNSDSGVTNDDTSDKYGMELNYNTSVTGVNTSTDVLYGGNITSVTWKAGTSDKKAYAYDYDELGQIKEADYKQYVSSSWSDQSGAYDLSSISYDLNGNINALERKNSSGSDLHDLSYTYSTNSNLISSLTDNITSTTYSGYTYDDNGNMEEDKLKGFTYDYYPTLNKISTITKGTDEVTYVYDALGTKLKKSSSTTSVYYSGAFVYDNNKDLDYILASQGAVVNGTSSFEYQYNLTDHLGNVRVVVDDGGTVLQETDYYPFGLAFSLNNLDKNSYLYTSKEYQNFSIGGTSEEFFDFGARAYNPVTARWNSYDPLGEMDYSGSPYMNVFNDPIAFNDPTGMKGEVVTTSEGNTISNIFHKFSKFLTASEANDFWDMLFSANISSNTNNSYGFSSRGPTRSGGTKWRTYYNGRRITAVVFSGTTTDRYQDFLGFHYDNGTNWYQYDKPNSNFNSQTEGESNDGFPRIYSLNEMQYQTLTRVNGTLSLIAVVSLVDLPVLSGIALKGSQLITFGQLMDNYWDFKEIENPSNIDIAKFRLNLYNSALGIFSLGWTIPSVIVSDLDSQGRFDNYYKKYYK